MVSSSNRLTIEAFLELPEGDLPYELINGQAIPKMSPKYFHSAVQAALIILLQAKCQEKGRIYPEWGVKLQRNKLDWIPVPDLTYISDQRLGVDWILDEACPVAPELVIEIISPGQTFGDMTEKATDYLQSGVNRVWLVDTKSQSITVFYPDALPKTFRGTSVITDELLPELAITPQAIFQQAGLA
jgi:Uma2 family endonuclease